jgi:hypothetical protein
MRKLFGIVLMIVGCGLIYPAYKTATKELGRSTAIGQGKVYTRIYTPFDYQMSDVDQGINDLLSSYTGTSSSSNNYQKNLEEKAKKYQGITLLLALGALSGIGFGLSLITNRKSTEPETESILIESNDQTTE